MAENLLRVRDLGVTFEVGGRHVAAVEGAGFDIAKGETVALVGESGSGKSVTALSVLQLLPYPMARHTPGSSIRFRGEELVGASERQLRQVRGDAISMIFQEPMTSLNPLHSVEKQINETLILHKGLTREAARKRTLELLDLVGITEPAKRLSAYPHELSGGQRQRVMIAMALANEPDLLIADEPTTALDVTIQAQILKLLKELQAEFGMAMLLITHDLAVVRKMASQVSVMTKGEIVEQGATPTPTMRHSPRQFSMARPTGSRLRPASVWTRSAPTAERESSPTRIRGVRSLRGLSRSRRGRRGSRNRKRSSSPRNWHSRAVDSAIGSRAQPYAATRSRAA